jgi:hypothetical protein
MIENSVIASHKTSMFDCHLGRPWKITFVSFMEQAWNFRRINLGLKCQSIKPTAMHNGGNAAHKECAARDIMIFSPLSSFSRESGVRQLAQPTRLQTNCTFQHPGDLICNHLYSGVASFDSIMWRFVSLNSILTKGAC